MDTNKIMYYTHYVKSWTKQQQRILGLSDKEVKILGVLRDKVGCHTVAVSKNTNLPRITTRRILLQLSKRGLVQWTKEGKSVWWTLVDPVQLANSVAAAFNVKLPRTNYVDLSEVGSLTIYRGVDEMIESNRNMLKAHPGERVLAIEPNSLWKYFAKINPDTIQQLNLLWKEKQIMVEMVTEEGFEKVIADTVDSKVEQSFLSLVVDVKIVPRGTLDSATEILIFRDQMLVLDWAHDVAVEIKNPSTLRVIKAMFRTLQASGREYSL